MKLFLLQKKFKGFDYTNLVIIKVEIRLPEDKCCQYILYVAAVLSMHHAAATPLVHHVVAALNAAGFLVIHSAISLLSSTCSAVAAAWKHLCCQSSSHNLHMMVYNSIVH